MLQAPAVLSSSAIAPVLKPLRASAHRFIHSRRATFSLR
ncbi:Uncharacterised protein [Mycobacteroides abscessus subsp. abscessus]|nr:Uncharacterised protein [Mycobacteroides abscessus subsp. abscessus]